MNIFERLIDLYEQIPEKMWATKLGKDGGPRCAIGHMPTEIFLEFKSKFHTNGIIFANDGVTYPQPTPKQRVIAYCKDQITLTNPAQGGTLE